MLPCRFIFKDNILGVIALQSFAEMIKLKNEKERIEFVPSKERMQFKSRDLFEVMMLEKIYYT
jgi:hypothetical protein